tara:strand:- start:25 stop:1227 length:1203 start_codon:yes stop_codon:yes gene_type:complete
MKKFLIYLKIVSLSAILSIYLFQIFLTIKYSGSLGEISKKISLYENSTGKKYDLRTKYEFYNDLKKINNDVTVVMSPAFGLEYFGQQHFEDNLFPLSGFSYKKTINCNENGYYSIFQSDRFGFNNPDSEWDSEEIEFLLVGDSFTMGSCVNRPHDIASNLRILSSRNALNLGYVGNGPLFQYATLREYLDENIKNIIWLYYENDVFELNRDLKSKILLNYLNNEGFSQKLKFKQDKINNSLTKFFNKVETLEAKKQQNDKKEKNSTIYKIEKFITLKNIRELFLDKYFKSHNVQKNIRPEFEKILYKSKELSNKNNSNFYFVFLPSYKRYAHGYDKDQILYNEIKMIVKKLNIKFIDIHTEFLAGKKNPIEYFPFQTSGHYNIDGYKEVSKIIYEFVREN